MKRQTGCIIASMPRPPSTTKNQLAPRRRGVSAFLCVSLLSASLLAVCLSLVWIAPAQATARQNRTLSGDLLSALVALQRADFTRSEAYLSKVFTAQGGSARLRSYYFLLSLALGKRDQATELARQLSNDGTTQALPHLVLAADAIRQGDKKSALEALARVPSDATRQEEVLLLRAVLLSHGDTADKVLTLRALQTLSEQDAQAETAFYFETFALDALGESDQVAPRFEEAITTRGMDVAEVFLNLGALLESNGEAETALAFYERGLKQYPENFFLATRIWTLKNNGDKSHLLDKDSLRLRAATALSDLARIRASTGRGGLQALADASLALFLAPDLEPALLLRAEIWASLGDSESALRDLARLNPKTPLGWYGTLERAEIIMRQDEEGEKMAEAETLLGTLANPWQRHELPQLQGGLARRQELWDKSTQYYDQAIAGYPKEGDGLWWLYYSRGIAHERGDNWDKAEADFLQALALRENQADVLNYLAYSWADQNRNLDRALEMLREAAGQRPDQGHIIDSLGWVYYRLGEYDTATQYLEEAASYLPIDAVVNDHLGDAYWQTGRKREARIQWERARAAGADHPDGGQEMLDALNQKLKNGLN